ncbi:hypothetical protein RchiOBHm_Chr2g0142891 [Rosa chinensis]|uniref:Uncharacterized protein n=1 Tax=Rosa chinensis TaxID=74649 RepID=A0A2P6RY03_ROSCH|nr:hypothetical protein RchiOBHm_Chr2g0142891 [Rosa chinensis]
MLGQRPKLSARPMNLQMRVVLHVGNDGEDGGGSKERTRMVEAKSSSAAAGMSKIR